MAHSDYKEAETSASQFHEPTTLHHAVTFPTHVSEECSS